MLDYHNAFTLFFEWVEVQNHISRKDFIAYIEKYYNYYNAFSEWMRNPNSRRLIMTKLPKTK